MRYLLARWPTFAVGYMLLVGLLLFMGISVGQGWLGFVPISFALFLLTAYFLTTVVYLAHHIYDENGIQPHHLLFDMGDIQDDDRFLFVELGLRWQPMALARRLTTGRIKVVDVYNPQLTESSALARGRLQAPSPPDDPRLEWLAANINLLPLPDETATICLLPELLSAFGQHGDRLILLRELYRVLQPNGQLLLAERVSSQANWLLMGPAAASLETAVYWRELLAEAGFVIRKENNEQGLIYAIRAHKPTPFQARQLRLELEFATA